MASPDGHEMIGIVRLAALWMGGCAPEVVRRPTQLAPTTDAGGGAIEILQGLVDKNEALAELKAVSYMAQPLQ
jgi:hypothetical protein